VVGLTGDRDLELRRAHDRAYDGERHLCGFQNPTLLDMQLDERVDIVACRARDLRGIEAALAHRRGDLGVRLVDRPDNRPGTPEVCRKAGPLFFTDRDDFERPPRLALVLEERLDGGQPGDDAKCAVEPAAVAHRVDVRSGEDALSFISPCRSTPHVADGIPSSLESGVFQPALNAFDAVAHAGPYRGRYAPPSGSAPIS